MFDSRTRSSSACRRTVVGRVGPPRRTPEPLHGLPAFAQRLRRGCGRMGRPARDVEEPPHDGGRTRGPGRRVERKRFAAALVGAAGTDGRSAHVRPHRRLRDRRRPRPRRHGRRVQGLRRGAQSLRRHQDAPAAPGDDRGGTQTLCPRGPRRRRGGRRARHADSLRRRVAGRAVPGDAVCPRRVAAESASTEKGPLEPARVAAHRRCKRPRRWRRPTPRGWCIAT